MRTDENLKLVCDCLLQNCGDLHDAARAAGMSPAMLTKWMQDDEVAAKEITNAQQVGWLGIESALIQRAIHGVEKGVYYKGERVDSETQYSDALLVKLAEARLPAYSKREGAGNMFLGPTQINIMPRADSYEGWLEMKNATLRERDKEAQDALNSKMLPAPANEQILEAEFTDLERPLAALADLL